MKPAKNIFILFIIISMLGLVTYYPVQAQVVPLNRLVRVEQVIFGQQFDGDPLLKRIERLEDILYGKTQEGSLMVRAQNVINYVLPSYDNPSLIFKINTLEWSLLGTINQGPVLNRIGNLEQVVFGQSKHEPLQDKVDKLMQLSLPGGQVPVQRITLPADTLVRIKLLESLSSDQSRVGEEVDFKVVNDINYEASLVIPEGTTGTLKVQNIERAGKLGKDGSLTLSFSDITGIDGTFIPVTIDEESRSENRSRKLAIGASVLGTVLLGPLGIVAGFFVEGDDEELPAGSELYIQTKNSVELHGLVLQ